MGRGWWQASRGRTGGVAPSEEQRGRTLIAATKLASRDEPGSMMDMRGRPGEAERASEGGRRAASGKGYASGKGNAGEAGRADGAGENDPHLRYADGREGDVRRSSGKGPAGREVVQGAAFVSGDNNNNNTNINNDDNNNNKNNNNNNNNSTLVSVTHTLLPLESFLVLQVH